MRFYLPILIISSLIFVMKCNSPSEPELEKLEASIKILFPQDGSLLTGIKTVVFVVDTKTKFEGRVEIYFDSEKKVTKTTVYDTSYYEDHYEWNDSTVLDQFGSHSIEIRLFDSLGSKLASDKITGYHQPRFFPPIYENGSFHIEWETYQQSDFYNYEIFESLTEFMDNPIKVYTSSQSTITEFTISGIGEQERRYYQLIINTTTGDSISSPIVCGSSYQKIVYQAFDENSKSNMELYTVDIDGENRIRLTNNWKDDSNPHFSPDGLQIVYVSGSGRETHVMKINGNHRKGLSYPYANDALPQFTPDGSQIVFLSQRDGNYDIFKMNADGTNPSNLTNTSYHEYFIRVSPDGNQIVYAMEVNRWDIGLIGIDGSDFKHLTSDSAENYHPEFSPDGLKVVYESRNQSVTDLMLMNIADTSKINLTENFNYVTKDPKFSPDGNKIIFHSTYGVYLIDVDGSNVTHLVDNTRVYSAQFSPDGSKIAFMANGNIFLINVDGSNLIQLTKDADLLNNNPIFQPIL